MTEKQKPTFFHLRHDVLVCLFIVVATLAVYWQVQHFDFVNFDDNDYVYENRHVQNGLTLQGIAWAFTTTHTGNWHPLTWLSHMLDCQLFGLNPGRHHSINLIFHIVNTLLLFLIFRKMTRNTWQSSFVAALFALHPLHVESVAWVSERKDVLSAFFWMLTMWSYIRYVEHPAAVKYFGMVLFFILGLLSKPMLVTLPFVLLLLDYWPLNRLQNPILHPGVNTRQGSIVFRMVWEKGPLFILTAISIAITVYAENYGGSVASLDAIPLKIRIANSLVSYAKYVLNMVRPLKLAVLYPYPTMFPWWKLTGACFLLVSISWLAIRFAKQRPYFIMGWLWYIGTFVPVIGLVQVGPQSMADRYTYIPFVGLFVIIAWGIPELVEQWKYRKQCLTALAAVVLVALTIVTWKQTRYWKDSITLFGRAIEVTSDNFIAHNNLALALEKQNQTEKAIEHYQQSLQIKPSYIEAHNNLGNALEKQGRIDDAIDQYHQALRLNPDYAKAHNNLGNALAYLGRLSEAVDHYSKALRLNPDYAKAHNNLGNALEKQGRTDDAINQYHQALRINPNSVEAHNNLGNALAKQNRLKEAISHYVKALQIDPDNAEVHNNLGVALAKSGKIDEAIDHYNAALHVNPGYVEARVNLGIELDSQGRIDEAVNQFQKALSVKPEHSEALYYLAKMYINQSEYEKALLLYQKIIHLLPDNPAVYYNVACIYARQNKPEESVVWLRKAVVKGFNDWNHVKTDKDLAIIRNSEQYKAFIKGH